MNQLTTPRDGGLTTIIERAATDPNFDIDKLQRLLDMKTDNELRDGDRIWNEAHARAEAEMGPISADASNPQTRSRYATFARLDGAVRPIYTRHGFGISWNTEMAPDPGEVRVVGMLTNGIISRRYQYDVPIETTGAKGTQFTTKTWAKLAATSYGKRILLTMMFNLAVGDDDDRNRAGGLPPRTASIPINTPSPQTVSVPTIEVADPATGEITTTVEPAKIPFTGGPEGFRPWAEILVATVRAANKLDVIDQVMLLNQDQILKLRQERPGMYQSVIKAIDDVKLELINKAGETERKARGIEG